MKSFTTSEIQPKDGDVRRSFSVTNDLLNQVLQEDHDSPFLNLLFTAMKDTGCKVKPSKHIVIEKCDKSFNGYGGFDSYNNEIVLCEDKFAAVSSSIAKQTMDTILSHELVHAFDHCRANIDFYDDPRHSMCSEIRAASLSGQCMLRYKLGSSILGGFKKYHQKCVKNYAMSSFRALHPTWTIKESGSLMNEVFEDCYRDTEPFDRLPLTRNAAELSYKAYKTRHRYVV